VGTATIRSLRERIVQTLAFEAGGLLLITPLYGWVAGAQLRESLALLMAVSVVVMAWSAVFNTAFDTAEHHLTGRVASDRPARWRTVHALAHRARTGPRGQRGAGELPRDLCTDAIGLVGRAAG